MNCISTEKAPAALGPYSQAVKAGDLLYISGQIPLDPASGKIAGAGIDRQTEQVCKNIDAILKAAGSDFDKVVKATCFLADMDDFPVFNEVYGKYFISKPARSCVAVSKLPKGALCEVDVIAEL